MEKWEINWQGGGRNQTRFRGKRKERCLQSRRTDLSGSRPRLLSLSLSFGLRNLGKKIRLSHCIYTLIWDSFPGSCPQTSPTEWGHFHQDSNCAPAIMAHYCWAQLQFCCKTSKGVPYQCNLPDGSVDALSQPYGSTRNPNTSRHLPSSSSSGRSYRREFCVILLVR